MLIPVCRGAFAKLGTSKHVLPISCYTVADRDMPPGVCFANSGYICAPHDGTLPSGLTQCQQCIACKQLVERMLQTGGCSIAAFFFLWQNRQCRVQGPRVFPAVCSLPIEDEHSDVSQARTAFSRLLAGPLRRQHIAHQQAALAHVTCDKVAPYCIPVFSRL